jgi:hypothetical protein
MIRARPTGMHVSICHSTAVFVTLTRRCISIANECSQLVRCSYDGHIRCDTGRAFAQAEPRRVRAREPAHEVSESNGFFCARLIVGVYACMARQVCGRAAHRLAAAVGARKQVHAYTRLARRALIDDLSASA